MMGRYSVGILDRLFRTRREHHMKESRTVRLRVQSGSGVVQSDKNYEQYSEETYLKNIICYRCIEEIARSAASPSWNLYRIVGAGNDVQIDDHPVLDLLKRPNPSESWNFLILKAIGYLCLAGNSFIERVMLKTVQEEFPKELYILRPDKIKIHLNKNTGRLKHYEYRSGGGSGVIYEIDPITLQSDLLHLKLFHPINDFWGAGPVEPSARTIDSSNEASDWNLSLLRNQGRPGMVFTLVGDISDDEFTRFERSLNEKFSGAENVGKNLLLTGENGTKAEPYSFSPHEMEFIEGNRELARGIALAWGVPPMLLGIPGDNTYSNYKEARLAFWEGTVTFYLNLLRGELNNWLFTNEQRLKIDYITDDIPALEPRQESKWDRAEKAEFLSINEKRKLVGYETWGEAGDVILVDASKIPLALAGEDIGAVEDDDEEEKGSKITGKRVIKRVQ